MSQSNTKITDDVCETQDLYFAGYLMAIGCGLFGTESNRGRVTFGLRAPPGVDLKAELLAWSADRATVRALAYSQAVKSLKSLAHAI